MSEQSLLERLKAIRQLAKQPLTDDHATRRVEIIMLKFKEEPAVIDDAIHRIIHHTNWPFKLTVFDNRLNSANTSKIWNKLIEESTCEYVVLIDSDAYVPKTEPCWLTRMMESVDETGVVVPVVDNVGGSNKATGAAPYPSPELSRGIWGGMCFLVDKWRVLERYGTFDEDFYIYGQDSEWAHRVGKGLGTIQRNDVFVRHLGSYSWNKANAAGEVDRDADKEYAGSLYRLKTRGRVK